MDKDDISRFATERCNEVAGPLINELAVALDLDLVADGKLAQRVLVDFAARMFEEGFAQGHVEGAAHLIAQLPREIEVDPVPQSPQPDYGPLGDRLA